MILITVSPGVSVYQILASNGHFLQSGLQTKASLIHPGSKLNIFIKARIGGLSENLCNCPGMSGHKEKYYIMTPNLHST